MKLDVAYKNITAIIFFVAFLAQTFSKSFVLADYFVNTSKYAKDCVNKAKPTMHCNGKCQMMKKLQQEERKDQENPERKAENKNEIVLSSKSFAPFLPALSFVEISTKLPYSKADSRYSLDRTNFIFRPPKA